MVNRFLDAAFFYDAGQVAQHKSDLNLDHQQRDYGFGARIHTPFSTVLRVDVARSREGTTLVFSTSPVF
jgi:outer membrane translocation and assembly module TamA